MILRIPRIPRDIFLLRSFAYVIPILISCLFSEDSNGQSRECRLGKGILRVEFEDALHFRKNINLSILANRINIGSAKKADTPYFFYVSTGFQKIEFDGLLIDPDIAHIEVGECQLISILCRPQLKPFSNPYECNYSTSNLPRPQQSNAYREPSPLTVDLSGIEVTLSDYTSTSRTISERHEVSKGAEMTVTKTREISHRIQMEWNDEHNLESPKIRDQIAGAVFEYVMKTIYDGSLTGNYEQADRQTLTYSVTLDGNVNNTYNIFWEDVIRNGTANVVISGKLQRISFNFVESTNLKVIAE